jgi:hypothetical protein
MLKYYSVKVELEKKNHWLFSRASQDKAVALARALYYTQ